MSWSWGGGGYMSRARTAQPDALAIETHGALIAVRGVLGVRTLPELDSALARQGAAASHRTLDLGALSELDTSGALFLSTLRRAGASLTGLSREHRALVDLVGGLDLKELPKTPSPPRWRQLATQIGRSAEAARHDAFDILVFIGRAVNAVGHALAHWRSLRPASISR